jgi:LTXXQ motif family protein
LRGGGGGGPGGGGGFHAAFGGGGHGGGGLRGAFGGGGHGFPAHGGHALSAHSFAPHAVRAPRFASHAATRHSTAGAAHNLSHGHTLAGNGRTASHTGVAGRNALTAHTQSGINHAVQGQLAHNQIGGNQLTHNQFAAQNFHGLNNFRKTGFNRNAFGSDPAWNHWGGNFWGVGWNNWGGGWGGWGGPVFWPYLLGDVLSFILWPYDYYDPFWAYGPGFIYASIFAPGPYFGLEYGYGPDYYAYGYGPYYDGYAGIPNIYYDSYHRSHYARGQSFARTQQTDREALAETNTEALQSCSGLAPDVINLPTEQIREKLHLAADQQSALDSVNDALSQARDVVKSSCPTTVPLTPIGRLKAAEQRLEATIKAVQIVRPPLETFYDLLSDEQRNQFNAMGGLGAHPR